MGKKKKENLIGVNFGDKRVVNVVTNSLNKHGKIKGSNKKETRALIEACPHHAINKHGKIKPKYKYDSDTGKCTCKLCGKTWSATVDDIEKIKKKVKGLQENIDQAKIFNVSVDGGESSQRYLAEMSMGLSNFPKVYGRLSKAVQKQDQIKKNKKKNQRNTGSASYGSWR